MARAKQVGRPVEHFYEAARQITLLVEAASPFEDTPRVSAHGLQAATSRARERIIHMWRQALSLADADREVIHPFIRARCGTRGAGAR